MSAAQRAAVDAALRQARASRPADRRPTVEELRQGFAATMAGSLVPDGIATRDVELGGRRTLRIDPVGPRADGTILYFHGGGWVLGSPETALGITAHLVKGTGMSAFSLEYRLAPEHPFPAAIDDAVAAYRSLLDTGTSPERIAFAGDSAGGNLAVTATLVAREAGLPLPVAIVTFSAALDATGSGESMRSREGIDPVFTREYLQTFADLLLAGQDPDQPLVSPAVGADLRGFPPMLLQAGGNEVLLDDSSRLADLARTAGGTVVLDVTADVPHVFQSFAGVLDEADAALERAALFITQQIRR